MESLKRRGSASSEENDFENSCAHLEFSVNYPTKIGQIVHICGNVEELGNWNADESPKLQTNTSIYPIWKSIFSFALPIGMTFEYKYVLIDQNNNKIWEHLPNNSVRNLTMKKPGNYLICNEMGNLDLKIIDKSKRNDKRRNSKINLNLITKEDEIEENEEKNIKNLKFKYMKEDYSKVASDLLPIDLISYENNIMSVDIFEDYDKNEVKLSNKDRIVMVTVYLPISIEKKGENDYNIIESDNSLLFRYINKIKNDKNYINIKWVGLLKGLYNYNQEEQDKIIEFLRTKDYYPVTPEKKELDYFIYYLERVMYPVFLNNSFNPSDEIFADSKKYVDAFYNVNKEYVKKILSDFREEDLISIHNIGLAFVADRLMHRKPNSHIGIYIHIDLPSSDVIKMFPYYQEIFRCFILCDVIGFHDFTSARNFFTIMRRFFGIFYTVSKKGLITLQRSGRTIIIHIKQAQLNYNYIEELKESAEFKKYDEIYQKENKDYDLVVTSFDYLICLMPICAKIKAIDLFLENNKELQNKAFFRMWIKEYDNDIMNNSNDIIPKNEIKENKDTENINQEENSEEEEDEDEWAQKRYKIKLEELAREQEYKKTMIQRFINYKQKITQMASNVMKKYNNNKLIKIEYINDINDAQANNIFKRLALFKNTDIFLYPKFFFTQSLIVKEFFAMQSEKNKNYGAIVNENMASMDIQSTQSANPYDPEMICKALKKTCSWKYTKSRLDYDLKAIKKKSLIEWVKDFLLDLKNIKLHDNSNKQVMNIDTKYIEVIRYGENFKHLEKRKMVKYYKNSHNRLILFNYENTLKEMPEFLEQEKTEDIINNQEKLKLILPDKRIKTILKSLCNDKQNMVFIISSFDIKLLQILFKDIDNLGLCGENGFYYKYPSEKEFNTLVKLTNTPWKEQILRILKMFSERAEGAQIQEKASCISWSYSFTNADSYFTQIQAEEIKNHLISIIDTSKLDLITQNDGTLLIRPHNVNKGAFLAKILQDKIMEKKFDFIFVLGNGESDEEMFKYLKSAKKYFNNFKEKIKVVSVTVNKQVSMANYFLNNIDDCLEILDSLIHKERNDDVKTSNFYKKIYYNDYEYESGE